MHASPASTTKSRNACPCAMQTYQDLQNSVLSQQYPLSQGYPLPRSGAAEILTEKTRTLEMRLPSPREAQFQLRTRNSSAPKISMPTLVGPPIRPKAYTKAHTVIKLKLANSTEAELRSLQSSLRVAKDDTASDLQRSVFKKYPLLASCVACD